MVSDGTICKFGLNIRPPSWKMSGGPRAIARNHCERRRSGVPRCRSGAKSLQAHPGTHLPSW